MNTEDSTKQSLTNAITDGAIGCRNCGDTWERAVSASGEVAPCDDCGDGEYSLAAPKEEAPTCWHCSVVLAYAPRLRCEDCPTECDGEGCDEVGCTTAIAATTPSPDAARDRRKCSECGEDLGFSEADPCDRCVLQKPTPTGLS